MDTKPDTTLDTAAATRAILAGLCASLVGIGLARFAYTPLIPPLIDAHWFAARDVVFLGAANLLGYLAGTLLSFALNRVLTFGMRDRVAQRLAMFLGVAAIGFGASAALLALLVDVFHVDPRIAKLLTLPMVVVLQFTLNRKLTFNAAQRAAAPN